LLAAAIDFVKPRADALVAERRQEREQRWAGSDEVDETGRRRDRRGFSQTRTLLRDVDRAERLEFASTHRYSEDPKLQAPAIAQPVDVFVGVDRWWARSRSECGWYFGIAGEGLSNWFIDGADPPERGPWDGPGWSSDQDEEGLPNWENEDW
jgi:hypothetical protein